MSKKLLKGYSLRDGLMRVFLSRRFHSKLKLLPTRIFLRQPLDVINTMVLAYSALTPQMFQWLLATLSSSVVVEAGPF